MNKIPFFLVKYTHVVLLGKKRQPLHDSDRLFELKPKKFRPYPPHPEQAIQALKENQSTGFYTFQKRAQVDNLDHLIAVPEEVETGRLKRVVAVFHTHLNYCVYIQ